MDILRFDGKNLNQKNVHTHFWHNPDEYYIPTYYVIIQFVLSVITYT